ncbi:MAG TPA: hypothetical protein VNE60_13155 [Gemmatimonadaceae bacterium]|nr:hypothetical protein [Gemmatimonadaceae bacterium]
MVFGNESSLRHLPFFEEVATHEEHEAEWRAATAGLVVLRLFDAWLEEGASAVVPDSWNVRAVRTAIEEMDDGTPMRAILGSIVDAMQTSKGANTHEAMPRLMAYGRALEYDGRWALAVDVYDSVIAHTHPVEESDTAIAANLQRGFCLRTLGRFEEAQVAYTAAGAVAESVGDMIGVLRGRIGDAKLAVARGNLPYAETVLDETIAAAAQHGVTAVHSRALHDRAMVAGLRGNHELTIQLAYEALRESETPAERDRILSDIGTAFHMLGIRSAARDAFLVLSTTAQEQYTRWMAMLSLMTIAAEDGFEPVFLQFRRSLASAPLPPELRTEYYLRLGRSHRALGQDDPSQIAFAKAVQLAEHHGFNTLLFEAEQLLAASSPEPSSSNTTPDTVADIVEAVRGMRELTVSTR